MARGNIYEISTDHEIFMMDESDFYESLGAINADYVKNVEDPADDIYLFLSALEKYGAVTGHEECFIEDKKVSVPYFEIPKKFKKRYFKARFYEMKSIVSCMKLKEFAEEDPFHLRFLIHNTIGDAVYYEDCFHTLDMFVREYLDPGERYYIGNVVFMH